MRVVVPSLLSLFLLSSSAWAVENTATQPQAAAPTGTTAPATTQKPTTSQPAAKPAPVNLNQPAPIMELTPAQIAQKKAEEDARIKALVKNQLTRMQQLEKANLDALAQNQALQLKNDNLNVQVQVLQSERSAQIFMYGAATMGVGVLIGFLISSYIYTKRRRQW
ncbi:hypothetical protein LVY74_06940 [Acinetobacter sp. ME22]|uniref:hypothetical protein n=1 Tax=Acinetobacter sp. ME22 TaxID=2904802 RepID=UPI001EDC7F90|nr:hypothetical protein [Acinetobacter sp. ME22]MCG2573295.1 hypothetical protein [Acinetobacter sp. ME22]